MPFRRIGAYCVDYLVILIWMAGLALAAQAGWIGLSPDEGLSPSARWSAQGQAFLMLTLPVFLYFTLFEAFGSRATLGKRITKLRVTGSPSRVVLRNFLKFLPWEIAHMAIWHGMAAPLASEPSALGWMLFTLSLSLSGLYFISLFLGQKSPPYDRIAGTAMIKTS